MIVHGGTLSPYCRKVAVFAAEKGIDPSRVTGSGPGGRIVRADIVAAEKSGSAKSGAPAGGKSGAPAAPFTGGTVASKGPVQQERVDPVSTMRGVIAKRMVESTSQIPYAYLDIEIDAAAFPEIVRHCSFDYMKAHADKVAPLGGVLWQGGAQTFVNKGTNGRWRDTLSAEEVAAYEAKALAERGGVARCRQSALRGFLLPRRRCHGRSQCRRPAEFPRRAVPSPARTTS